MSHVVKCIYCGKTFDRDKEECVKINRRYAHSDWYTNGVKIATANEEKYRRITDYIVQLDRNPDWKMIGSQIKSFLKKGLTYDGIYYSLYYLYSVKKKPYKGIGIVPYIYDEARRYYERQSATYAQALDVSKKELEVTNAETTVTIKPVKANKKLISFDYD